MQEIKQSAKYLIDLYFDIDDIGKYIGNKRMLEIQNLIKHVTGKPIYHIYKLKEKEGLNKTTEKN